MFGPIQIISSVINLGLVIGGLALFFRLKKPGDPRMSIALNSACAVLAIEVIAMVARAHEIDGARWIAIIIQDVMLFFKMWALVYVGQVLWHQQGVDFWGNRFFAEQPRRAIAISLAAVGAAAIYTVALFWIAKPSPGPVLRLLEATSSGSKTWLIYLAGAHFAIAEEFIFRGCYQPMLARWFGSSARGDLGALFATAAVWTLMHAGMLSPDWVKFVQLLPLGIFLGFWFRQAGFVGAAGVHLIFNAIMMAIGDQLLAK